MSNAGVSGATERNSLLTAAMRAMLQASGTASASGTNATATGGATLQSLVSSLDSQKTTKVMLHTAASVLIKYQVRCCTMGGDEIRLTDERMLDAGE